MTEHPLFVPCGDDHLAAVLTLPEGAPRALVLLARNNRGREWARTARALAERGIASVRMDHLGDGDSTGTYRSEKEASSVPWARAVLDLAGRITGVSRLGVLGHCRDARQAVALAARMPEIEAILLIVRGPRGLAARGSASGREGRRRRWIPARWRRFPGRLVRRFRGKERRRRRWRFGPEVAEAARTTDIVLALIGPGHRASRFEQPLARLRASAASSGHRIELHHLPGIGLHGFRIPPERRDEVAATLAAWLGEAIDRAPPLPAATSPGPRSPSVERTVASGGSR